jgi:hypothetical protein
MLRVFLGDGRKALGKKYPGGKKEVPPFRRIFGLQTKETRLRRIAPDRNALPAGKGSDGSPH